MKIVWAVDPFAGAVPLQKMGRYLENLGGPGTALLAAYVAGPAETRLSIAYDVPESARFSTYPRGLLKQTLQKNGVAIPDRRVRVLTEPRVSLKASADRLVAFAQTENADAIAVFSHSMKGLKRLMMGSFAETLVHRSAISVLVINPVCDIPEKADRILFATDLGAVSVKSMQQVARSIPARGARLLLFHASGGRRIPSDIAPALLVAGMVDGEEPRDRRQEKTMTQLGALATEHGFITETIWDDTLANIPSLILKQAKKTKANLIVVTAQAGPVRALFLGSVTRELLRSSPQPVLVVRS